MFPADFHFLRPYWFIALVPLTLLVWRLWSRRLRRNRWEAVCDPDLLPKLLVTHGDSRPWTAIALLAGAWLLAVIALAGPTWSELPQPTYQRGGARVIALALSRY
jgi:Ca-activated chloride channel family protein